MTNEVLKVEGLKELTQALNRLGTSGANKAVRSGVRLSMNEVKRDAQANVPVDSGNLRRNITVQTKRRKSGAGYRYIGTVGLKGDGFYGSFIELGFVRKTKIGGIWEPPRPFLRPAFDKRARKMPDILRANIEKAIAKERARLKR